MPNTFTPDINQKVWMEPTGNAAIRWDGAPVIGHVESVKRQYYYVTTSSGYYGKIKVDRKTHICLDHNRNYGFIVFDSREAFDQAQSRKSLLAKIRSAFDCTNGIGKDLPYDSLQKINNIIEEAIIKG